MQALQRALVLALLLAFVLIYVVFEHNGSHVSRTASETWSSLNRQSTATSAPASSRYTNLKFIKNSREVLPSVKRYYEQAWALGDVAKDDELTKLTIMCSRSDWRDDIYLQCGGIQAGITSIYSMLRVCVRMAAEAGVNLVLPVMAERNSEDLKDFRTFDPDWNLPYGEWFDEDHFRKHLAKSCPKMKISQLDDKRQPLLTKKREFGMDLTKLPDYQAFNGWAWPGQTWREAFLGSGSQKGLFEISLQEDIEKKPEEMNAEGVYLISVWTPFLFFKIAEDITGFDREVWQDMTHLIRALPKPRMIVNKIMDHLGNTPYIGVHYRGEKDNIWISAAEQLERDLIMAEQAWNEHVAQSPRYKDRTYQKSIYLACGDQQAIDDFTKEAESRGWHIFDKWTIAAELDKNNQQATMDLTASSLPGTSASKLVDDINALPFDHQGSVDLMIVSMSTFFIGFTASAFSYTTANTRDPLGKYRGSTIERPWDADGKIAASHLFPPGSSQYVCCF